MNELFVVSKLKELFNASANGHISAEDALTEAVKMLAETLKIDASCESVEIERDEQTFMVGDVVQITEIHPIDGFFDTQHLWLNKDLTLTKLPETHDVLWEREFNKGWYAIFIQNPASKDPDEICFFAVKIKHA